MIAMEEEQLKRDKKMIREGDGKLRGYKKIRMKVGSSQGKLLSKTDKEGTEDVI